MIIKLTKDDFIIKANTIHNNKYNYDLVKFNNNKDKIKIGCGDHFFVQKTSDHLGGHGCPICAGVKYKTTEEYISECKIKHNNLYTYEKTKYTNNNKLVTITCKIHGCFEQEALSHLVGHGCPTCNNSKGEFLIRCFIEKYKIEYICEKPFDGLIRIDSLYFDFYLPKLNICIEFDGIQHFKPIKHFGGIEMFKTLQECDGIKNKWCLENNIKLIRISYRDINRIEKILKKELNIQ